MLIRRRNPKRSRLSWRALAFEVFAVVLGVTLALGANELRQHFAEQRRVEAATESIAAEMEQNCRRLERALDYHERLVAEIDSAFKASEPMESFQDFQRAVTSWRGYQPAFVTASAYETAQATGALGFMPYGRALELGNYYTFLALYQQAVRDAFGAVIQDGDPSARQVATAVQLTTEIERDLGPESCKSAGRLRGERVESDSTATAS